MRKQPVRAPRRRRARKRVSTAERKERRQAKYANARKFFFNYLSIYRNRTRAVAVTLEREPRTEYGEGYDLVGMYYDKKFLVKGQSDTWEWWTAKIISFDEEKEKYTGMYDDGYKEIMKIEELTKLHLHVDLEDTIAQSLQIDETEVTSETEVAPETELVSESETMEGDQENDNQFSMKDAVVENLLSDEEENDEKGLVDQKEDNLAWVLHPDISEEDETSLSETQLD